MKKFLIAAVIAAFAFPAAAQECTEAEANALAQELATLIEQKGISDEQIEKHIAEVEAHYGGEPSQAQTCEAISMLADLVASD